MLPIRPHCSTPNPAWPCHCKGWGIHNSSGQPVPVSHYPHSKEFIPIFSLNFCTFSLCPLLHVLSSDDLNPEATLKQGNEHRHHRVLKMNGQLAQGTEQTHICSETSYLIYPASKNSLMISFETGHR